MPVGSVVDYGSNSLINQDKYASNSISIAVARWRHFCFIFCAILTIFIIIYYVSLSPFVATKNALEDYNNGIGGFYIDPNHYEHGSFAGTRMISDFNGIVLIGSDDGVTFWTCNGKYINKQRGKFFVDFGAKNGPNNFIGMYQNGCILWEDGNKWTKSTVSDLKTI